MTLASFLSSGTQHAILSRSRSSRSCFWLSLGLLDVQGREAADGGSAPGSRSARSLGLIPPFLGPFIYMLFRPPEYLEDVRERELEIKAMEERIAAVDLRCPVCRAEVDASYPRLPGLHDEAQAGVRRAAGSPLEPIWQVCPYCETPIEPRCRATPPALGTRRARRSSSSSTSSRR